jgi:5-deoxy-glucuronate isomerase
MTSLLKRRPKGDNPIHLITPQNAGWSYVGFALYRLASGDHIEAATGTREACLVMISGTARLFAGGQDFGLQGERANPFDGEPTSLYVPAKSRYRIEAETDCEIAICTAPAHGSLPPRLIPPSEVGQETRGTGTNTRYVRNILPDTSPHAESLLVVEVITPGGHWSSYPPHKHDVDNLPAESRLEETYYHRIRPETGYATQRVYTDDRSLDETITIEDGDVVLVPRGYHPVGAAHGYDLYYLNVMAGPHRLWRFRNDPAHEWMLKKV